MYSYSLKCVKQNQNTPIPLKLVKDHLKVTSSFEDELILPLIHSASNMFENYTMHSLLNKTWCATYRNLSTNYITLPNRPAQKIIKIEMLDDFNNSAFLSEKNYFLEKDSSELNFKVMTFSKYIKIDYIAGYGESSESIPNEMVSSILNHIAFLYENRESAEVFNLKNYDQFKKMKI